MKNSKHLDILTMKKLKNYENYNEWIINTFICIVFLVRGRSAL